MRGAGANWAWPPRGVSLQSLYYRNDREDSSAKCNDSCHEEEESDTSSETESLGSSGSSFSCGSFGSSGLAFSSVDTSVDSTLPPYCKAEDVLGCTSPACSVGSTSSSSSSVATSYGKVERPSADMHLSAVLVRKSFESWQPQKFFSAQVRSSTIDPSVAAFMKMSTPNIISRFARLNPTANTAVLEQYLNYIPRFFHWAGADLFPVTTERGEQRMVVLETNSCPSGQKYMPLVSEAQSMGGYRVLLEEFLRLVRQEKAESSGGLAVVFDKNLTEVTGYADTLSALSGESVFLVEWYMDDLDPPVKFMDEVMYVRDAADTWHPIRAAFRYVTQKPWSRIPLHTKTLIFNPIQACLAGGRNKMLAAKAYEMLNAELEANGSGVQIRVPETILEVSKRDVPRHIASFGGRAVIKDPYSNCGQGVYTITNENELASFMGEVHPYDSFIIQSLIGSPSWSSETAAGNKMFHRGTLPDEMGDIYAFDLRMLCYSDTTRGFRPLGMYSRRARVPLTDRLKGAECSWGMLGTNLSCASPTEQTGWVSDVERVVPMDSGSFSSLGLGVDDLISGFVQTVLCTVAIDKMACHLHNPDGSFNYAVFSELNDDPVLLGEITH